MPILRHPPRAGGAGALALASLLALAPAVDDAHAQVSRLVPVAPSSLTPANGTYAGAANGGTPITLSWVQPIFPGVTLRPNATHFLICVQPYTSANAPPPCSVANARWIESVAAPSPALTRSGHWFHFAPGQAYADTELDRQVRLSVVACAGNLHFSCTPASTGVWFTTKNIVAREVGDPEATSSEWRITVQADNTGTTDVTSYSGDVSYWEVLGVGSPGRSCRVDVDAPEIAADPTLWIIDVHGTTTPMQHVPRQNGAYDGPPVVGIYRTGDAYEQRPFVAGNPPDGVAIPAGATGRGVAVVSFPVAFADASRTFVVLARHDTRQTIKEQNERDNTRARCMRR